MEHIIIASTNPVKVEIIEKSFRAVYPSMEANFTGVHAPSGVSEQPATEEETYRGAHNRLDYIVQQYPDASYWAALEGGIEQREYGLVTFGFLVVRHKYSTLLGVSKTAEVLLPRPIASAVLAGKDLGTADDAFFGVSESGKKMGAVGLLTDGLVNRLELFLQSGIIALSQLKHEEWYE